jgi:AraC-like DNA-binding protein
MVKNRYKVINFTNPSRILPQPDITIEKTGFKMPISRWDMPWCVSRTWRLYWNDTPGAVLKFNDNGIVMSPGTMVLIPPNTPAAAATVMPFIHNFIEFHTGASFFSVKAEPMIFETEKYSGILSAAGAVNHRTLALYVLVGELLLAIPAENMGDSSTPQLDERIKKVLEYMEKHSMQKYSLGELCRCANLSKPRFLALFKENIGLTPRMYWRYQRMELIGKMLIETDLSISEIATQNGFVDRSHLSRVFKTHTGATPAQVRKNFRKN